MKALIVIRNDNLQWFAPLNLRSHPAMLPICNKPLLEYLVDFMVLNRCESISINMEEAVPKIEDYFGNGERWGTCISYKTIKNGADIDRIIDDNNIYSHSSSFPLIVFDGLFFIHYDKFEFNSKWIQSLDTGLLTSCDSGSLLIVPTVKSLRNVSTTKTGIPFSLSKLADLDDYYMLNMEILEAEQKHYVLPGYKESKDIILGKSVRIGKNVAITPPVILGDNVNLLDNVRIGPHSVVGPNVILDENNAVEKSIVWPNTYVGKGLKLYKKIVDGNRIIDIEKKDIVEIEDAALFSVLPEAHAFSLKQIICSFSARLKENIIHLLLDRFIRKLPRTF